MIFGFKKKRAKRAAEPDDDLEYDEIAGDEDADGDQAGLDDEDAGDDAENEAMGGEDDEPVDKWEALDASEDWRANGPFDIDEVDLAADEVERMDFGAFILTPFPGMKVQIQAEQQNKRIRSVMVSEGRSGIEIAVFAAPAKTSMVTDIRADMINAAEQAGGRVLLAEGPFGTEIRRVIPVDLPDGRRGFHHSRTWLVQGPRWLLRGTLMGDVAQHSGSDGDSELWYESFANIVVRRDNSPRVPGELIPLSMPKTVVAEEGTMAGE